MKQSKTKPVTQQEIAETAPGKSQEWLIQEICSRLHYMYYRLGGVYELPYSQPMLHDVLKMMLRLGSIDQKSEEVSQTESSREQFWDGVKKAAAIVSKWPEWKRNVLGPPLKRIDIPHKEINDE